MSMGFRKRLLLVHMLAVVLIVTCAAAAGWWLLSQSVLGQLDAALLALGETEAGLLAEGAPDAIHVHEPRPGTAPPSLVRLDRLVQIIDADGQVLARSNNLGAGTLPVSAGLLRRLERGQTVFETLPKASEEPLRMAAVPVRLGERRFAVLVAGSLDDADHIVESAALLFGGLAVALLLALAAAGAILTGRLFGTVERIAAQARRISDASLGERLAHPGSDDEIGHLVDTLNSMLARLQRAFELQRNFTANAAHEIRSPLSRLRTEIELSLRRPRSVQEQVATLQSCLEEVVGLTSMVEELLQLARLDAGQESRQPERIALDAVMREAIAKWQATAAARRIRLELHAPEAVHASVGERAALLVLNNLLDNAIKFSAPDSAVEIRVFAEGGGATLEVLDRGPGIASGDQPQLFERFYRGRASQQGQTSGAGLGLAIVRAVLDGYGASITLSNRGDGMGAACRLHFPHRAATPQ
ncbi:ATP-binding protein [Herbaspirillum huttiense]|uniref:histidine kinase n=3 Tax=Herbaspirillum huttiense TaxID=863372 RepID=A0AAJ2HA35_9BURK|nr:ATP-binding protein [Herbaspirillum huttiense]MDR9837329.1 ATP-binding protein [Herbaspirillum huttiense]UWE19073.1 ATP-binding protein [Herbaspirillum huttiense]